MEKLRTQLQSVNQKILQLFSERRKLVQAIVARKRGRMIYSPAQEWLVFQQEKSLLLEMGFSELLSFSLLMESHAHMEDARYPRWSRGVHLTSNDPEQLSHQMNPLLLKTINPDLFAQLFFKEEFLVQWENLC